MFYLVRHTDLAGFDLIGRRQEDGTLKLGPFGEGEQLDDWPEEAEILGKVFILEEVKKQDGPKVPENKRDVEWGIYV